MPKLENEPCGVVLPTVGRAIASTILFGASRGDRLSAASMTARQMLDGASLRRFDIAQRAILSGMQCEANAVMRLVDDYLNGSDGDALHLETLRGQAALDFLTDAAGDSLSNAISDVRLKCKRKGRK